MREPIIRELPRCPESFNVSENLMIRAMDTTSGSGMRARLIIESWNPWGTLPIVVMPADEYDAMVEKHRLRDLHFGGGSNGGK